MPRQPAQEEPCQAHLTHLNSKPFIVTVLDWLWLEDSRDQACADQQTLNTSHRFADASPLICLCCVLNLPSSPQESCFVLQWTQERLLAAVYVSVTYKSDAARPRQLVCTAHSHQQYISPHRFCSAVRELCKPPPLAHLNTGAQSKSMPASSMMITAAARRTSCHMQQKLHMADAH